MPKAEAKAKFKRADDLFRAGWFDDALLVLNELNAAFPANRQILYPQARCLAELGRYADAFDLCDEMIAAWDYQRARNLKERMIRKGITPESVRESGPPESAPAMPSFNDADDMPPALSGFHEGHHISMPDDEPTPDERMLAGVFGVEENSQRSNAAAIAVGAILALVVLGTVVLVLMLDSPAATANTAQRGLGAIGMVGWIGAAAVAWLSHALILSLLLRWAAQLPYDQHVDNALDVLIVSFVATMMMAVPVLGFILAVVVVKQRYQLSWKHAGVYVALEAAAIAGIVAIAWTLWGGAAPK